jgi:hypothetical protein
MFSLYTVYSMICIDDIASVRINHLVETDSNGGLIFYIYCQDGVLFISHRIHT